MKDDNIINVDFSEGNDYEDVVTVITDDGEVDLMPVEETELDGKKYVLMVVLDDNGEETEEAAVFEVEAGADGEDEYLVVEDEWILDELYEIFGVES